MSAPRDPAPRWRDWVRVVPVLGVMLWMVPILWGRGAGAPMSSSSAVYLFAIWGGLVVVMAVITSLMPEGADDPTGGNAGAADDGRGGRR